MNNNSSEMALTPLNYSELVERPQELIAHSKAISEEFVKIVDGQSLFTQISDKKHVHVDGWSMLGILLGIFPYIESVERINIGQEFDVVLIKKEKSFKNKDNTWTKKTYENWIPKDRIKTTEVAIKEAHAKEIAYKAKVTLKTLKGQVVGAVESICSNREDGKLDNEEYAINSMAQTRAVGKAFRLSFGWIARVAGYDSTPFEEVDNLYPDRDVEPPHASQAILENIREIIDAVKTEEDYKRAVKELQKFNGDLKNQGDKDYLRSLLQEKQAMLKQEKADAEEVANATPGAPEAAETTEPEQPSNPQA